MPSVATATAEEEEEEEEKGWPTVAPAPSRLEPRGVDPRRDTREAFAWSSLRMSFAPLMITFGDADDARGSPDRPFGTAGTRARRRCLAASSDEGRRFLSPVDEDEDEDDDEDEDEEEEKDDDESTTRKKN